MPSRPPSALKAASATFAAFVLVGAAPLLPFVWSYFAALPGSMYVWSVGLTAAAFLMVGALKARFVGQARWRSALETLALGGGAAAVAYWVGVALGGLAPGG